jgi:hypothetical protein
MDKFSLQQFQQTGLQVVRNFFEPDIAAGLAAVGERVSEGVRKRELTRTGVLVLGLDVDAETRLFESEALRAVAVALLGQEPGDFFSRILIKAPSGPGP